MSFYAPQQTKDSAVACTHVCLCVCGRETVCVCVFELQNDLCAAYDGNISFMTLVNLLLIALNTCHSNNNEQKAATHIL